MLVPALSPQRRLALNFLPLWALKAALALCVPLQMSVLLTISPFFPPCIETIPW